MNNKQYNVSIFEEIKICIAYRWINNKERCNAFILFLKVKNMYRLLWTDKE